MRRLQRFGLTATELERYIMAMMRDSAQLAEQVNSISSINSLDFVMESLALGNTVMSHGWVAHGTGIGGSWLVFTDASFLRYCTLCMAYGSQAATQSIMPPM